MPLLKSDYYTTQDIFNLPDDKRAELIDGEMYMMAPPSSAHQILVMGLSAAFFNHIQKKGGPCKVLPAPFAVFIKKDDSNYVEPDVSVICNTDLISDRGCEGAPDLVIEVVSPSSRRMDYNIKNALYSSAGVREYWIVDPAKERTTIYYYEQDAAPMIIPFHQEVVSGIYKDLKIKIADLLK